MVFVVDTVVNICVRAKWLIMLVHRRVTSEHQIRLYPGVC